MIQKPPSSGNAPKLTGSFDRPITCRGVSVESRDRSEAKDWPGPLRSISIFDIAPSIRKCAMSGISYRTPEELFAELPATYLWAVKVPDETVWWSQKDLAEHAGCPLPRYESTD